MTNGWSGLELQLLELKEIEREGGGGVVPDPQFIIPSPPELVVNNIVKFNTTSGLFVPIGPAWTDGRDPDWFTGVRQSSDPNSPALVRHIECTGTGHFKCDEMYLGGTFDLAFGSSVSNLIKVTNVASNMTSIEVSNVYTVEAGVVTTVTKMTNEMVLVGGIFGPDVGGDKDPVVGLPIRILNDRFGLMCPISVMLQTLPQCRTAKPVPVMCCETFFGAVFASLKLSNNEVIVGGDFANPVQLISPDYPGIPDGLPPNISGLIPVNPFPNITWNDTGLSPPANSGARRRQLDDDGVPAQARFGVGYR